MISSRLGLNTLHQRIIQVENSEAERYCEDDYGFNINENKPKLKSVCKLLTNESIGNIISLRSCKGYHNLCEKYTPPASYRELLSLGLKFYIKSACPKF